MEILLSVFNTILSLINTVKSKSSNQPNDSRPVATAQSIIEVTDSIEIESEEPDSTLVELNLLQSRIVELFEIHGIVNEHIYQFLRQYVNEKIKLNISDQTDLIKVIDQIDDSDLQKLCTLFGVNTSHIYGIGNRYRHLDLYKHPHKFINLIFENYYNCGGIEGFIFKSDDLDFKNGATQVLYLALRTPIGNLFGEPIYRYLPVHTVWDWGYIKSRYELKSIFRFQDKYQSYFQLAGLNTSPNDLSQMGSQNFCPHKLISEYKKFGNFWHTYDYANSIEENEDAKEYEEFDNVRRYYKENDYHSYSELSKEKALINRLKKLEDSPTPVLD
ncbi:MAG: hypothetical protein ABJG47_14190 [Ekhidna sp.]